MVEILSNTCLYNIFETYFSYWGYLLAVNLRIYLGTSSLLKTCKQLPGINYVAKNWALAMMLLKGFAIAHFWSILLLKEQMMTCASWSDLCKTDRFVVKFALKITTKLVFFTDWFLVRFAPKTLQTLPFFPQIFP